MTQNVNYYFSFLAKTIVCYRLHNSDTSVMSIAGIREELFLLVSNERHVFKIRFLHLWFKLLSQILCTPSELTTKCVTYINGRFSLTLTQLLTMF